MMNNYTCMAWAPAPVACMPPPAVGVMNRSDDIAAWFALSPPEINL